MQVIYPQEIRDELAKIRAELDTRARHWREGQIVTRWLLAAMRGDSAEIIERLKLLRQGNSENKVYKKTNGDAYSIEEFTLLSASDFKALKTLSARQP